MPKKTVGIVQSCYIPWRGFFDLVSKCDEFILYDDMQFTKRDWRNRNQLKTAQGLQWLTIPVNTKGRYLQKICDTTVQESKWAQDHWRAFVMNYSRAAQFEKYKDFVAGLYETAGKKTRLSEVNFLFLAGICELLKIPTKLSWSTDYELQEGKTERLMELCRSARGTEYVSGPSAANYIDTQVFERAGIDLCYIDYSHYPLYPQLHGEFTGTVTILDSIFNQGAEATRASLIAPLNRAAPVQSFAAQAEG